MQHIDAPWARMQQLTEETLTPTAEKWIGKSEIVAILDRRTRMQAQIDKPVRATSEAQVFIR